MKRSLDVLALAAVVFLCVLPRCGVEASVEEQCGQGEVFAQPERLLPLCYPVCQGDGDCEGDNECTSVDGVTERVCLPHRPECDVSSDCATGELCQSGECVGPDEPVGCESDADCELGTLCDGGACAPAVAVVDARCETACQNVYGECPALKCSGLAPYVEDILDSNLETCLRGGLGPDGTFVASCSQRYGVDAEFTASVDELTRQECATSELLEEAHCEDLDLGAACGCSQLNVGDACSRNSECTGGYIPTYCATQYPGGYCASITCDVGSPGNLDFRVGPGTGCGNEGVCQNFTSPNTGEIEGICLRACTSNADCRDGYSCELMGEIDGPGLVGRCLPACSSDADCQTYTLMGRNVSAICSDQGVCEAPCGPAYRCPWAQTCKTIEGYNPVQGVNGACSL